MFISNKKSTITLSVALMLAGCVSGGAAPNKMPLAFDLITISLSMNEKATIFTWQASDNATEYSLCRKDVSMPKSCDVLATSTTTSVIVNDIGIIKNLTSEYFVIAKNSSGEIASNKRSLTPQDLTPLIQYIKASNTEYNDQFGNSIALSSDGNTLAVAAWNEDSDGTGVNSGHQDNNNAEGAGAVYLFRYSASTWTQEAYIKASNTESDDSFGRSVALSSDGNTLAVGAIFEDSDGTGGKSGHQDSNNDFKSGAVYLFRYSASIWTQEAYIKASNPEYDDRFGHSVALSSDGNTLAVGAVFEDSTGTGVNSGSQVDYANYDSGAVYLFRYSASTWAQEAYIKASNTGYHDKFGHSVALSSDGNTLAVGAVYESSNGTGVNPDTQANNDAMRSGAVYLFRYSASTWTQEAYIKASNPDWGDVFGYSVALSSDGNTLAVGAVYESSNGTGVNPDTQANNDAMRSGAVYLFRYSASTWAQEAYIKASNTEGGDGFGHSVALSSDGNTLAVGAGSEASDGTGVNSGHQDNNNAAWSGAVYLFRYSASTWAQEAYIKASNTEGGDGFGYSVALSSDGNTLAVSTVSESSNGIGVNSGAEENNGASMSGAVYLY
ncbi:hypothetical protein E2K03_13415 [Vibrio cholerae]|uniref:FG-GAP repeat protein n=1 Tax=Vibrio cholerae TaxID=666 RepID=UPI001EC041DF|nr:hypothetical protein [Vibrio cholerae]EHZ7429463.1 FG-GAP repeat protein [Vibrio cholerae]EJL6363553.1 FG-GAP repeat protein [Vibrio cholerae]EKF9369876.1 FG-GAP repeat protein [Vibrio cholerae]WOQ91648.1 FG-GAP repeat protein [Vibrio cholerae]